MNEVKAMPVACHTYAAKVFVASADSPRVHIEGRKHWKHPQPKEPFPPFNKWFVKDDSGTLGLGDLVVIGKGHVAVATGSGNLVVQSGYPIRNQRDAARLKELIRREKNGDFQVSPKPGVWAEFKRDRNLISSEEKKRLADKREYDNWPYQPNTVRLDWLLTALGETAVVYHLKPEAREYLDPQGPVKAYIP